MKSIFAAILVTVLFVGCSKNDPVSTDSTSSSSGTTTYSAATMYKTAGDSTTTADNTVCTHDSLRNVHMLDSIKTYLTLSDEQYTLLQTIGDTLYAQLKAIHTLVKSHSISCDSSRVLVDAARAQFVASVNAILTTDQQTLFTTWLSLYWTKAGTGGGSGGRHGGSGASDSIRTVKMLDSLKTYLSLSDAQYVLLQSIRDTLISQIAAIEAQALNQQITLDSIRVLMGNAKAQFVASVNAILTTDQAALFSTWLTLYWEQPKGIGHGGGRGHQGGMH
jgi:hypothetical protein